MINRITQSNAQYINVNEIRTGGGILPSKNDGNVSLRQESAAEATTSGSFDFTNMSPREFGDLVKSGGFGDDLPPLVFLPTYGKDTAQVQQMVTAMQDTKINYTKLVSNEIEFKKSIGASTDFETHLLNKMLALQGGSQQKQPMVNSYV